MNKQENKKVEMGREDINTEAKEIVITRKDLKTTSTSLNICFIIACLQEDINKANDLTNKHYDLIMRGHTETNIDDFNKLVNVDKLFGNVFDEILNDLEKLKTQITFEKYCKIYHAIDPGCLCARYCIGRLTLVNIVPGF